MSQSTRTWIVLKTESFFFIRLRNSGTKSAGFWTTVHKVEFFLANASLLETFVSVHHSTVGRRGWQNVSVWQTWRGYYLRVLPWSSFNILCFLVFYKKISLKESQVWRKVISKQNYCHACHTRFAVFLLLPSCCVSSLLRYKDVDGRWNVALKANSRFFSLHRGYSISLALSNVRDLWSRIPKSLIQVKKEKENFVVACFGCMISQETIRNDDF